MKGLEGHVGKEVVFCRFVQNRQGRSPFCDYAQAEIVQVDPERQLVMLDGVGGVSLGRDYVPNDPSKEAIADIILPDKTVIYRNDEVLKLWEQHIGKKPNELTQLEQRYVAR